MLPLHEYDEVHINVSGTVKCFRTATNNKNRNGPLADRVQVETILIFAGTAVIMCALYAIIKLIALVKDYD